ncbi:plasmid pRiA4b ORF-3 family protein [Hoeflea sp.]|uniref:plasmid pRiA4b ORF-3 family protein n=1 Tax=Hoeflea sp. TaxID=1940281 RepID=UPI0019CDCD13|nr:plasmid pRiA4b ORF-3 family protein [Hoeflea sp.]MBC7282134.1 plasmid pRiA4b ORF-3 family protein [Hoeflea sp.]
MFKSINAVQIHVSLDEIAPQVWRRLVVPAQWDLGQLHLVLQAAFNWWNYHLFEFRIGGLRYGDVELLTEDAFDDDPRVFDIYDVRLCDFAQGSTFTYVYDFGDNWHHTVVVEEFLVLDTAPKQATCVDGARARPPEDVGGVPGYERFLEIISDRDDPEYVETFQWCGGYFDPAWFDLALADKDTRSALRADVKRRLHQPRPKPISKSKKTPAKP